MISLQSEETKENQIMSNILYMYVVLPYEYKFTISQFCTNSVQPTDITIADSYTV